MKPERILGKLVLVIWLGLGPLSPSAHGKEHRNQHHLDSEQIQQAIRDLAQKVRSRYAIANLAEKTALLLEQNLDRGSYRDLHDPERFVQTVTSDLQRFSNDKHFRFGLAPVPEQTPKDHPPQTEEQQSQERAAWEASLKKSNYGFRDVSVLPGNIGYLDFRRFQPPQFAGDTLLAAMAFLANCEAMIIDLRHCSGGNAYMNGYLATFFFPKATKLYDMDFRGDQYTEHFWTQDYLPGKRFMNTPLYILTSAYTFSGAEAFAYRFKILKRAIIVGEQTAGGANAGGVLDVPPFFRVYMPMGRPVDPDTGTNWEGTGVLPDIETSSLEALSVARVKALEHLQQLSPDEGERKYLSQLMDLTRLEQKTLSANQEGLLRFTGDFGPFRVSLSGGQLRMNAPNRRPLLLRSLCPNVFCSEALEQVRLTYTLSPEGSVTHVRIVDEGGQEHQYPAPAHVP